MKEAMISQFASLFTEIFIAIILPMLFYKISRYLRAKEVAISDKLDKSDYDFLIKTAKQVFFIVEEKFKNSGVMSETKKREFDNLMKINFSNISQADIDHLRQATVGEYNKTLKPTIDSILNPTEIAPTPSLDHLFAPPPNCSPESVPDNIEK